jgi:WD40 repeat protein
VKKLDILLLLITVLVPLVLVLGVVTRIEKPSNTPCRFWAVSFLPDGDAVATAGGSNNPNEFPQLGELVIWDVATGKEKRVLRQKSAVRTVACSPDGKFAAIGDFNGFTKLVSTLTAKITATLPPRAGLINAVAISADGKMVASANFNGVVTLWYPANQELHKLTVAGQEILNVALSPASPVLVATTRKGNAYLFDLNHTASPLKLQAYQGPPVDESNAEAIAFSPDGQLFVTGCQTTLRVWETGTGKLLRDLAGNSASVNSVAFSPDGKTIAAVDSSGGLTLWNPTTGERGNSITAHAGTSFCVAFTSDGKRLATIGRDDYTTKIWDAETLARLATLRRAKAR